MEAGYTIERKRGNARFVCHCGWKTAWKEAGLLAERMEFLRQHQKFDH